MQVTEKAMRPVSSARECFYCNQPVGADHKPNCVMISRRAKVRVTIEYEINVPADWEPADVEFNRNDGSWCSSNLIGELKEIDREEACLCPRTHYECLSIFGEPFLDER